jgi:hypothetical protein
MLDKKAREAVDEFVKYVERYCSLIENLDSINAGGLIEKLAVLLPALYINAIKLPTIWSDSDDLIDDYVTSEMAAKVSRKVDGKLGKFNWHWCVFEPFAEKGEADQYILSDDLADIYRDLKDGLEAYKKDTGKNREEAIWAWKFNFEHHWGDHLTAALRAIHQLIVERPFG